jgi:hypothetical protein
MSTTEKLEFFELGDKTALICADNRITEIATQTLREFSFKFHTAETPELALERIRYTSYNCIVLHENFAGSTLRSNAVLNVLALLPMSQRRTSFICLVGPSLRTLDAMQAFVHSVQLVVNPSDLPNFGPIVKKGLAEFEGLYRVYNQTVAEFT